MERAVCRNTGLSSCVAEKHWFGSSSLCLGSCLSQHAVRMFRIGSGWVLRKGYSLEGRLWNSLELEGRLWNSLPKAVDSSTNYQSSRSLDSALRCVLMCDLVWSHELDSMILMCPFQLRKFYDSIFTIVIILLFFTYNIFVFLFQAPRPSICIFIFILESIFLQKVYCFGLLCFRKTSKE